MGRSANIRALAATVAVLELVGCQLISSLERPHGDTDGTDASVASPEADTKPAPGVDPCASTMPAQPTATPQPSDLTIDLVFSYYDTRPQPPNVGADICATSGFDLDTISCDAGTATDTADAAPVPCRQHCGPNRDKGIDDRAGELFAVLRGSLAVSSDTLDSVKTLEHGSANVMMRILHYNGLSDDDEVTLNFYALSGLAMDEFPILDGGVDASDWVQSWDRQSIRSWYVESASVSDPLLLAPNVKATGYVRDHVLVVHADRMPAFGGISADVERTTLTGKLVSSGGRWSIVKGRVGGEVTLRAVARSIQIIAGRDEKLCQSLSKAQALGFCKEADRGIEECDTLSLGASFTMVEGRLGPIRSAPPPPTQCDAALCP